ncbi:MAG: hypothetical protein M1511_03155 [Deltaproteobacteria bacterium]|nr:hypothetical protein [Deltaproteobacteria bacterium]
MHRAHVKRPTDQGSVAPKWNRPDDRNEPEGGGQSHLSDPILDYIMTQPIITSQFIPCPGLGSDWRLQTFSVRDFTAQRIYDHPDVSDARES